MDKSLLRAVSHLAQQSTPISLSEMRELILRHLLSEPDNDARRKTTKHLFECYLHMLIADAHSLDLYNQNAIFCHDESKIRGIFQQNYALGFQYGLEETGVTVSEFDSTYVPPNLPLTLAEYPKDIVEQYAAVMGYVAAINKQAA